MDLKEFAGQHAAALAADEIRYNVFLAVLRRGLADPEICVRTWSLGRSGCCAIQQQGYGILLGDIRMADAELLARIVAKQDIPSVMGADETARWFVDASRKLGQDFPKLMSQTIQVLDYIPSAPPCDGSARLARADEVDLVYDWFCAFAREALPHEQPQTATEVIQRIEKGRVYIWCVDNQPVSIGCVGRVLDRGVAIAPVYTPPEHRCLGYARAVTAAIVNEVFERGFSFAYLFTDDANLASNRCYAKVGFVPYCKANMYRRD